MTLYDMIGPGPHPCHWCGTQVDWSPGRRGKGDLISDHVDGDTKNNSPENIVPSCHPCNIRRGHDRRLSSEEAVLETSRGRNAAQERVCLTCKSPFFALKTKVGRGEGNYCSKACSGDAGGVVAGGLHAERAKARSAAFLPRIQELRSQKVSYDRIAQILDEEGVRPLRADRWSGATIYKIVHRNR